LTQFPQNGCNNADDARVYDNDKTQLIHIKFTLKTQGDASHNTLA